MSRGPTPYVSYRDASAAIDFLTRAYGFEKLAAFADDGGVIQHAELKVGDGVVMLGTSPDARPPVGSGTYLLVDDVDAHHAAAVAAGAEVLEAPSDTPFGTRRWRSRDPEGFEWSFGTYAPGGGG